MACKHIWDDDSTLDTIFIRAPARKGETLAAVITTNGETLSVGYKLPSNSKDAPPPSLVGRKGAHVGAAALAAGDVQRVAMHYRAGPQVDFSILADIGGFAASMMARFIG